MDKKELDVATLTNEDLAKALDDAYYVDLLEKSPGWQLVMETCKRTAKSAQDRLLKVKPSAMEEIAELQQIVKLYGGGLRSLVDSFRQYGALAFPEAKRRKLVQKPSKPVQR